MTDPYIVADDYAMDPPPFEKLIVILPPQAIGKSPVREVMQSSPPKRMVLGIYAIMSSYGAELSYPGFHDIAVIHNVAVVSDNRFRYL
jgi:hypothetical protein